MNKFLTLSFASLMAFVGFADSLSDYGVIDYVKSTRQQWVVTDYYPNPKTWMEAVVGFEGTYSTHDKSGAMSSSFISAPTDSAYACYGLNIGNSKGDDETTIYAWLYKGSGSGESNLYGKQKFGTPLTASTNTLVVQNGTSNSSVTWGGTAMTTIKPRAKTTTCANPLAIFGTTTQPFAHYDFSVYSIKIYESDDGTKGGANEVLKHDFIPVTNNLGVAGLYDRVANKFFSSASGTELVAGVILPTPTISGTLVMNGWEAGETPSQPSGLTTDLGTLVYRYYTDSACTQSMATPTTSTPAGTYYVRGEVDASASWNAAVSAAVAFTVTGKPPTPGVDKYYMVGSDASNLSSMYASSAPPSVGWAESVGGTVLEHTVSGDYDYEIPKGATMRTRGDVSTGDLGDAFNGRSLTLGGSIMLKRRNKNTKTITFSKLIADGDGTASSGRISSGNEKTDFTLAGVVSVPEGKCLVLSAESNNNTTDTRTILVQAKISGAGKVLLGGNSYGSTKTFELQSTETFTGAISTFADTSSQPKDMVLRVTGGFAGSIESLPEAAKVSALKFNADGLGADKRLVVSSTTIPDALKTKLILYSSDADFTAKNFRLMTFPSGTTVTPSAFTVKYATSVDGPTTAFTKLGTVGNPDGTISLVANYDFIDSLATSSSRVSSSPFALGGIVWKQGDDYIHIFTNNNGLTIFKPKDEDLTARVLLVAGGGAGGGSQGAAGGGAGGMVEAVNVELTANEDYVVMVGAGAPSKTGYGNGANGGNSSVSNATAGVCTTAFGGGGGGRRTEDGDYYGQDGGSGGGGGSSKTTSWKHDPGCGISGQGNDGGEGYVGNGAGGGGGAGAEGSAGTSSAAGAGGAGKVSAILGYDVIFAGGGGGSWNGTASSDNSKAGAGGVGGGGNGGNGKWSNTASTVYLAPTAGEDGLGGGGGGASAAGTGGVTGGNQICSGAGGDGLVVIRYTDPTKAKTLPKVYLTSVTPNNDATATIAWSMTGAAPLTLKALYGVDSATLNITNTISTTATPGEDSTTLGGLLPGRTYYVMLLAENAYGNSGVATPTSFVMPEDGPMPQTPTVEMPVIASKTVKDQTGLTTIDVVATLFQAGTGSSFADCTATVRWGTENILAQMTSSKSASVASDGTVTISPDNLGTETYYGCIEVVNANGRMDRVFFSFVAADTSTYQWKEGVAEGAWKDRNSWTGAPNDWGLGYPTDRSTADMTSVNCATVHVAGVITCAKLKMEKANAKYVFFGDDAAAAVYPTSANTTSGTSTILPDAGELVFDGVKIYLILGNGGCYGLDGTAKLVVRNGADVTVRRGGTDASRETFELRSADARLEIEGIGSKIEASNYKLAPNNKATAGGTIVLSGVSPTLNIQSVASGSIYADCFDGTIVCNIPADGWTSAPIPSSKLKKFASGSGSGKIVFTVPKTAPVRGTKDKTKTESVIVSCANGFEVSRITFGPTQKSSDYFYYTLGDAKYVYCTTDATKLATIDAPDVPLETEPAVTALKYHHEPSKGMKLILR